MRRLLAVTLGGLAAASPASEAAAAGLRIDVEIPRLDVAEYHRPYLSIWIERADETPVTTLAVWSDQRKPNGEGAKWLKDMRQWWRKAGRDLQLPADGVSGATRAPGTHTVSFVEEQMPPGKLPAGDYRLVVEAAREVGGREVVRVPFSWPPAGAKSANAAGAHELGHVTVSVKP